MDLSTSMRQYSESVTLILTKFFDTQATLAAAVDPHLLTSLEILRNFSLGGGKMLRPFLVQTAYQLGKGDPHPDLTLAAAATELHHKHILILDDIADRDETRYGGPTVEYAYRHLFGNQPESAHRSQSFAMLDSVWLGALARELLLQSHFAKEKLSTCCQILDTIMYRDTLAGWQIHALQCDLPLEAVTIEEFVKGLELVTARYTFEGPFKIGLTLAGNKDKNVETALTLYSQKIGTAFQIHDDILGLFGDSAKTGKPVGNDVREGKKTLLVQIAYQRANPKDQAFLKRAVGNPEINATDIERVQKIVTDTKSLQYSLDLEKKMVRDGVDALTRLPDSLQKQHLIELAHYVIAREK